MSCPVESVDWSQARQYCDTLTRRERALGRLPAGWQYRLPTEIEWEYACRAGSTTATAFGDSLGAFQAIFNCEKPYNTGAWGAAPTRPVPVWFQLYRLIPYPLPPNAWGLYGMHGNVAEWCLGIEPFYYPGTPVAGPAGWGAPVLPTSRGGSFLSPGVDCRSAARAWETTTDRFLPETVGFRVVLSPISFP
jgi:formylglycine-generating enzyme required for sulfatase activity